MSKIDRYKKDKKVREAYKAIRIKANQNETRDREDFKAKRKAIVPLPKTSSLDATSSKSDERQNQNGS